MGNYMCAGGQIHDSSERGRPSVKVVLADGTVEEFRRAVTVGELLLEHPEHLLCHSSALTSLSKKSILPAAMQLEPGRLYYLLPSHKFQGSGSPSLEAADSKSDGKKWKEAQDRVKNAELGRKGEGQTFEIKQWKGPGSAKVTLRGQDVTKLFSKDADHDPIISYSTPDLRSMYAAGPQPSLVRCNSWKPRLETIHEVGARRRIQNFVRGRTTRGSKSQVHSFLSN